MKEIETKWTPELAELVYSYACGWCDLFIKAQDILRELDRRKCVPFDLYQRTKKLVQVNELPKKYRKGEKR